MALRKGDLLQGTLDLLVLKVLGAGPNHGYGIATRLHQLSDDALHVEEGSLYPALYRMEEQGLIEAEWRPTSNNRNAKFYALTRKGRRAAQAELDGWLRLSGAVARVLRALQRRADARAALERALGLHPGYAAARLELALLDAEEGFVAEALESLRGLARATAIERPEEFRQGMESLEGADLDEAGTRLASALGLEPADEAGVLERARERLEAGDAEGAEELLRSVLPGRESWPDIHYLLGSTDLHRGRYDDALASLARALELNPDFHAARVQFARALEATGALGQAGEQVLLVLQSDPAHPQALELHERWSHRGRRAARAA